MKYIPRLLVAPFIFAIVFIAAIIDCIMKPFITTYCFVINGGEVLPYGKNDQKRIHDIYELLSQDLENKNRGN